MNATIEDTLLDLFQQVIEDPDYIPIMPFEALQEGSQERRLLASLRDMLECLQQSKRQAEAQLREKEEQYRNIFEATGDGLFVIDLDGFVVEANPAAYRQLGYTYEEMIGLHRSAIVHPDYHFLVPEYLQVIQTGDEFRGRAIDVRKDGTTFPVEVLGRAFTYRGRPHTLSVVRDVTKQVQAEQQLREREEQYRAIFEASTDAFIICDQQGVVVEANPAACRMSGEEYSEWIGTNISYPKPFNAQAFLNQSSFQARGQFLNEPGKIQRKDGTLIPVEAHSIDFTYKGQPHILTIVRNISERVHAEQQLREKEQEYRSIFEASIDGLVTIDQENHIVEANPAACQIHGYAREDLVGRSASSEVVNVRDILQAGGNFHTREKGIRKDGTTFHSEVRGTPFTYKGERHMLGIIRDITEQVEAEQQLREREEQYRSIFEATSDALLIRDLEDGHVVEANPAACQMYGYSYEEFIGLDARVITHPDSLRLLPDGLQTVRAGHRLQFQGLGLRKDGTSIHVEVRGAPFKYKGKPHLLGASRDITEQVQAQQLLEQRVGERTRELSTLLEVSHNVASTIDLKILLELILDQLKVMVDYAGAAITILEGEDLVLVGTRGPESEEHLVRHRFSLKSMWPVWEALCRGDLVVIDDIRNNTLTARAYRETVGDLLETTLSYVRSWVAVPLKLKDQAIGMLSISYSQPDFYTPHHAELALAIANQAAVAIENARLYAKAQELAALEERQKLARELHDSVSQALYGISLGAHAARTALERDPGGVAEPLEYVLSLSEAALAEMRALIFELRPESLETEGLVSALTKQAAATQARHEIIVAAELCEEPALSLHVKQELYRIAQEAMHNTVKHAHASYITLRLTSTPDGITLEVEDNGQGFDTMASFPGHLGLHSMRERVTNLGGTFEIESEPGAGTCIHAGIPT